MKSLIPWDDKPAIVTTATFKRIKDYVLGLKEDKSNGQIIVTPDQLRARLEATDADWQFTDAEMLTAVGHLENYGYVKKPAHIKEASSAFCFNRSGSTIWRPLSCWRRGEIRRGWAR